MTDASPDTQANQPDSDLRGLYEKRGFQQQAFDDYKAFQKIQEQRKRLKIPKAMQLILTTPFILLFCLGLIFIPFMFYLFFTAGQQP